MVLRTINKKGDPTDMLVVVIFMFILAVAFVFYYYFTVITVQALHNSPMNITETQGAISSLENQGNASGTGYIFIVGGMILGVIASSFWVREHPSFIPLYIIFILVSVVVAGLLGNAYVQVTSFLPFNVQTTAATTIIDICMRHSVRIALVVGVLSMIIALSKPSGGQV